MITLAEWAADLRDAAARCKPVLEVTLAAEMKRLGEIAAEMPGRTHSHWPPLAESTVEDKGSASEPLLREGDLKASISGEADGFVGVIGSTDPKARYHEFGTSRMPPRVIYAHVLAEHLDELKATFDALAARLLTPLRSYRI
jgi:phage gpG-like protein